MSLIGSVSSFFQQQTPAALELGQAGKTAPLDAPLGTPDLGGSAGVRGLQGAPSFGAILDHFVSDVNTKMEAGAAEQSKVLSGESTNLHQAMISMQEAGVAFSLMVEVRNKMVESYQELMRMQV